MRRTHLRSRRNILKRLVVHGAGFNLALLLRKRFGVGPPRSMQGCGRALVASLSALFRPIGAQTHVFGRILDRLLLGSQLVSDQTRPGARLSFSVAH